MKDLITPLLHLLTTLAKLMKQRNPRFGCPRIAQQINLAFGLNIDKDVSSLYFVSRGDGTSQFSDTLQEHNRAVRKYQLNRVQRRRGNPLSSPLPGKQQ